MSTANFVPETKNLGGGSVTDILAAVSFRGLLAEGLVRFRAADGFSFARALAFQVVLSVIPAIIALVAIGTRVGSGAFQDVLLSIFETLAPGPAGGVFRTALEQGSDPGAANLVVIVSAVAALTISGAAAMAQLQRGTSRIYGVERDRPATQRYAVALGLTVSVGVLLLIGFILLAVGESVGEALGSYERLWTLGRWPVGILAVVVGLAGLFKAAPERAQPSMAWLTTGALISMVLWVAVTAALALYLRASPAFGDIYGPLAGIVGLMLWAYIGSIAIMLGLAYAAQLEAHRAGAPAPTSVLKESISGPVVSTD